MITRLAALAALTCIFSSAHAALVQGDYLGTFSGNDSESSLETNLGVEVGQLARIDLPATSTGGLEISNLVLNEDDEPVAGQWSYSGAGVVDFIVIKAGNEYAVYRYTDANTDNMRNVGLWDTGDVGNRGLSHITAYSAVVPVPAAIWLMASGLFGLGMVRRRK